MLKEEVVVREVFDLDSRRFPPRIYNIKNIVNRLLKNMVAKHNIIKSDI